MADPFLGQVTIFAGNFAPRGWAFCDGQLMPISQYSALFSILGTIYGGDGRTTFALPDLRGRMPIGPRHGPGLSDYREGQKGGAETRTLNITNMPSHNHAATAQMRAESRNGSVPDPSGNILAAGTNIFRPNSPSEDVVMDAAAVNVTVQNNGGQQPFNIMNPYLAINYIIALVGIFPSRS
ncbi:MULTISPECIES: phage tail protein [Mameliella]|uniref:phage tail protein n=1 Tax=Mameliella TaxID=1434019 RepID=UPI000B53625C|nr:MULTISPECIES: tail fiber protein [Mameliella]MCR9271979.1 tail fiber protein [Paracoccaceae bacterium]OWV62815.1 phage tail protein [Mameliella alba]